MVGYPMAGIPDEVVGWVRGVFATVNARVSGTLSRIPSHHEDALDHAFIGALNEIPTVAGLSGWGVYIQTHFLGGRRYYYNWEIADIGVLLVLRDRSAVRRVKVGLLQSKRLYTREVKALPDQRRRYEVGFGGLLSDPSEFRRMAKGRTFKFDESCRYQAMDLEGRQAHTIAEYSAKERIPVYYLFYNPVELPWSVRVPALKLVPLPSVKAGCRVIPDTIIRTEHEKLAVAPSFAELTQLTGFGTTHRGGWSLEHFVADELLACREGYVAKVGKSDDTLYRLFSERSGPISAAVALTIEAPEGVLLDLPALEE